MCICVCALSHWAFTTLQPSQHCSPLISLLTSLSLIWSCYHAEQWDRREYYPVSQLQAYSPWVHRIPRPTLMSVCGVHAWLSLRLPLTLSSSVLALSRLACTICGSWKNECRSVERDWKTVLLSHRNWGKNLAYVLMCARPLFFPPVFPVSVLS